MWSVGLQLAAERIYLGFIPWWMLELPIAGGIIYGLWWLIQPYFIAKRLPPEGSFERVYDDPIDHTRKRFPSLDDEPTVYMSLVVPAYNEEERMSVMLDETLEYLHERKAANPEYTFEIIIVDDGSKDRTVEIARSYVEKYTTQTVRLLILPQNRGKGGAVRQGYLCARGKLILMVDADGATRISDLKRLEDAMQENGVLETGAAIGSRAHLASSDTVAKRKWYRNLLMHGFHLLVLTCVRGLRDTQCGFKLLSRSAAQQAIRKLHTERFAFDVELLYILQSLDIGILEVGVNWTEIPGSKVTLKSILNMGRDIVMIRVLYTLGLWNVGRNSDTAHVN